MNMNELRSALTEHLSRENKSLLSVSQKCGVAQASLWLFVNKNAGISGDSVFRLMDYLDIKTDLPKQEAANAVQ